MVVYATNAKIRVAKIARPAGKNFFEVMDRIEKLREFQRQNPSDSFVNHALALEFIKLGNDEEARALFESILQREPTYVGSYYHLAKLLERVGEEEKAAEVYKKGMEEAQKAGETLAFNELRSAYEELTF